jgi:hypothetical protein
LSDEIIKQIDFDLIESCGGDCVNTFHNSILPMINNNSTPDMLVNILNQFKKEYQAKLDGHLNEYKQYNATSIIGQVKPHGKTDLCFDDKSCESWETQLNKCTNMRLSTMQSYDVMSKLVNVFGTLIKTLCGCIFQGPISVCVLGFIPQTCTIWYNQYKQFVMLYNQLWMAVKKTSTLCKFM